MNRRHGPGSREHQSVDGGFECDVCGATRETPLGIQRHRSMCFERDQEEQS